MNKREYAAKLKDYPSALTVGEVSQILRVSDKLVYRLIRNESIAAVRVGRTYRIAKSNLIDYMRSRDRGPQKTFLC
ncbi:MAG: helix-turn-helix domain-containing protein [Oscillospiraceae bacterium]|nr:helix-turn-helix domain-containing protein [Oscillospiraceae bacterium]